MAERLEPVGDRVLIEPIAPPDKVGSIIVPDTAQAKPVRGKVTAVGPLVENIKEGDVVVYGKYSGTDVELEGSEVVLMHESDVIAVVRND